MSNLSAFMGYFLSYAILFGVFVLLLIVGCCIGITLRKNKNAKDAVAAVAEGTGADTQG